MTLSETVTMTLSLRLCYYDCLCVSETVTMTVSETLLL